MKLSKDTNILIVGLGLLGGSYAEALTKKGYTVNAVTKDQSSVDFALKKGIINYGTTKLDKSIISACLLLTLRHSNYYRHNNTNKDKNWLCHQI